MSSLVSGLQSALGNEVTSAPPWPPTLAGPLLLLGTLRAHMEPNTVRSVLNLPLALPLLVLVIAPSLALPIAIGSVVLLFLVGPPAPVSVPLAFFAVAATCAARRRPTRAAGRKVNGDGATQLMPAATSEPDDLESIVAARQQKAATGLGTLQKMVAALPTLQPEQAVFLSEHTLLRYLCATEGNAERALAKLKDTLAWRALHIDGRRCACEACESDP